MNEAHLHLILAHIPIVLVPAGAAILLVGVLRRSPATSRVALSVLVAATLFAIPAFLLGEGAEEVVEHLPGISKDIIEEHEEAAEVAFWLTVATGVTSLLSLVAAQLQLTWSRRASLGTLLLAMAASAFLGYAAFQGGKIRHPEAYAAAQGEHEEHHERDDDD